MTHGTAAIKFRNGTILDVAEIPGSARYVLAMKAFAENALRVRSGDESSVPSVKRSPVKQVSFTSLLSNFTASRLYEYLTQRIQHYTKFFHLPVNKPDLWVQTITTMLSNLRTAVKSTHPLSYPLVIISIPDFEADTGHIYKPLFESASQQAGFELLHPVKLASRSALSFHGIEDCYGSPQAPDPPCPPERERLDVVLAITYSNASMGTTLLTRWKGDGKLWGLIWPLRLNEAVDLGHDAPLRAKDPEKYWRKVVTAVVDCVEGESVDRVIYLGSQGGDEELRRFVKAIVKELGNMQVAATTERADVESLFAAARGAAIVARRGMAYGFDDCILSDWCKTDAGEGDGEEDHNEGEKRYEKSEL